MSDWCTIESDPGVFTSLIESFGVKNAQLTELWSIDDDSLKSLIGSYGKVHGLIFLFKWQSGSGGESSSSDQEDGTSRKPLGPEETPEDLFFAKQVTTNACATQAMLSILLNSANNDNDDTDANENGDDMVLGSMLSSLKEFTTSFPSDLKGEAIGASDEIRTAHNSFARKEVFLMDDQKKRIATDDDDVFHFIAYVPHSNGVVYELDGLQSGPISVGTYNKDEDNNDDFPWLSTARKAIQTRIEKYAASEIKFNLMALTRDKRVDIRSKISKITQAGMDQGDEQIQSLNLELVHEEEQRQQWKDENERRRHNYLPFCMELIRALASSGTLQESTKKANEKMAAARLKRLG
uniref:Ubiquitin carboxyl-terminal hydrolase n=1 Tax=Chaetoceros debilis TaxID=122233 RepID=A0A7S3PW56_9STRA|mmetsp:Transcript_28835/g.44076  ORF Transcript_28835/g.44076 Transcript_28835/m.44076 type:complete len:351 (+) Transcript_28835:118-1170(+)